MNVTDLNFFKAFLLTHKSSILNKSTEFISEQALEREHIADENEAASFDLTNNLSIHLQERVRQDLLQIERALSKFEKGTYGQCESCEDEIGLPRLKASPVTTLCLACKEEQEDPRNYLN